MLAIIAHNGKEVARLTAINPAKKKSSGFGAWKGLFEMPDMLAPMTGTAADALANICEEFPFRRLDLTIRHAQVAGLLPGPHRDPFDRLLAAQAIVESMPVLTEDAAIKGLGAEVEW
jgi:hypothetical protein